MVVEGKAILWYCCTICVSDQLSNCNLERDEVGAFLGFVFAYGVVCFCKCD